MNIKKTLAIIGSVMILGAGLSLADNSLQKDNRNIFQNKVKSKSPSGLLFLDENGDGICDFAHQWGNRNGFRNGNTWSNNSFRQNRHSFGNGVCNGSGPKGKGSRKGQGKG